MNYVNETKDSVKQRPHEEVRYNHRNKYHVKIGKQINENNDWISWEKQLKQSVGTYFQMPQKYRYYQNIKFSIKNRTELTHNMENINS